jgi:hypothetical protein
MLGTIVDNEYDRHLRIEARDAERRKVWLSIEDQPIGAIRHRPIDEKERFHTTIGVGPCMAQLGPALVSVLYFETNRDAAGRRTPGRIQYVGRDRAHDRVQFTKKYRSYRTNRTYVSSFLTRNSVILACSAAASFSSVSESFARRSFSAESISSEVLPVAQIMKINPNFSS